MGRHLFLAEVTVRGHRIRDLTSAAPPSRELAVTPGGRASEGKLDLVRQRMLGPAGRDALGAILWEGSV
jgi:hypothetical protein